MFDLTFTGFETAEIDNILQFEVIEPDDQDWTSSDPVTQVGDIWRVEDHIIACVNALSPGEVLSDILDGFAHYGLQAWWVILTEPSYLEIESWFPKGPEELYFRTPVHHNLKTCILC